MAVNIPPRYYTATYPYRSTMQTGQVVVGTTPTLVAPLAEGRLGLVVTNPSSVTVYIGRKDQLDTANGHALLAGNSISLVSDHALYAVVATGTQTITWLEEKLTTVPAS